MKKSTLLTILKLLVAVGLISWAVNNAGLDNVTRALGNMDLSHWALAALVLLVAHVLSMVRWYVLMRSVGLDTTPWNVVRLGFIGVFFNNFVPGLTGGDLIKAVYVTREHPNQRADAVISVIVDRLIGIVALAVIAAVILPFDIERYAQVAIGIYGFLAAAALGAMVVLSRRVKARLKGLAEALGRKPKPEGESLLGKLDRAVSMYRDRMPTVWFALGLSVVVHTLTLVAFWIFGSALVKGGMAGLGSLDAVVAAARQIELESLGALGFDVYASLVPLIMIISAIPIAPAGWGVGEMLFTHVFGTVDVVESDAVALSVAYRLTATLLSLLGGVFLVIDRQRVLEEPPPDGEPET